MIDVGQIKGLETLTDLVVKGDNMLFNLSGWPTFSFGEKAGYTVVQIPEGRVELSNLVFYLDTANNAINHILFDNQQSKADVILQIRTVYYNGSTIGSIRVPSSGIILPAQKAIELTYFATEYYGVVTANGLLAPL